MGHDSSSMIKDDGFTLIGQPRQDMCFLGPCYCSTVVRLPIFTFMAFNDTRLILILIGTYWCTVVGSWEQQSFTNGELEWSVDMSRREGDVKTPTQNFWHGHVADVAIFDR